MKPTLNEKIIVYLVLLSGLSISAVAIYYSVLGLTAIFAAAFIPIIIMGVTLEVSKLAATIWLKQNWNTAPGFIKFYLSLAVVVLMLITSMGIFGFLSKAHSDQGIISGDVQAKLALYDEKIKTQRDNIDLARRALAQLDAQVEARLTRGDSEAGAERAVQIRRQQAPERARLQKEIAEAQKEISRLNEERTPIAAETRKIEAEVGPIKYIAAFVYGETDPTILEKAVTWVILIIIFVFDPLAIILLLASQVSFQNFKKREQEFKELERAKQEPVLEPKAIEEKLPESIEEEKTTEGDSPEKESDVVSTATVTTILTDDFDISKHPYLFVKPSSYHPPGINPVGPIVDKSNPIVEKSENSDTNSSKIEDLLSQLENNIEKLYVQNEEQKESSKWSTATMQVETTENDKNKLMKEREEKIKKYVDQVKEGRIDLSQVPDDLLIEVRARV